MFKNYQKCQKTNKNEKNKEKWTFMDIAVLHYFMSKNCKKFDFKGQIPV